MEYAPQSAFLRNSKYMEAILETVPDAFVVYDLVGNPLMWNGAYREMVGYTDDEIASMKAWDFHPPSELGFVADSFARVVQTQEPMFIETAVLNKEGDSVPCVLSGSLLEGEEGVPVALCGVGRDVTDLKETERALRESEELYRNLVEMSPDAVILASPDGKILQVSDRLLEIHGYDSADELIGKSTMELVAPQERDRLLAERERRLAGRAAIEECRLLCKDGSTFLAELRSNVVRKEGGTPRYVIGTCRDITRRKQAEEQIRRSRDEMEAVLSAIPDLLIEMDGEGRYLQVRSEVQGNLYSSPAEVTGKKVEQVLPPEAAEAVMRALDEAGRTGEATGTLALDFPSGKRWFEFSMSAKTSVDGADSNFIILARDVTDRKQIQRELIEHRENLERLVAERTAELTKVNLRLRKEIAERKEIEKELRRLNIELEGYAHTVSHELRTPLSGIYLALEWLERLAGGIRDECTDSDVEQIARQAKANAERAEEHIRDLLKLAEAGQVPREVSDVDIGEVIREILEEKAIEISEKGIEVRLEGEFGHVRANITQVYQLFSNLIDNAVKHNDADEPRVLVRRLEDDEGGRKRYLVKDNGPGIPEEYISDIFLPFFRGEEGATGIGLATVAKITKVYGGDVRAYNNGGACFELFLGDFEGEGMSGG